MTSNVRGLDGHEGGKSSRAAIAIGVGGPDLQAHDAHAVGATHDALT